MRPQAESGRGCDAARICLKYIFRVELGSVWGGSARLGGRTVSYNLSTVFVVSLSKAHAGVPEVRIGFLSETVSPCRSQLLTKIRLEGIT